MELTNLLTLTVLCFVVWFSVKMEKYKWGRQAGAALLSILFTAVLSNLGIVPSTTQEASVYTGILTYIAPISLFYLLLDVRLTDIKKAGLPIIVAFLLGSMGTVFGVLIANIVTQASVTIGENYHALAGMITGTYIGGSINFNAVALHFGLQNDPVLYTGAVVADNIITTLWMIVTLTMPLLLKRLLKRKNITTSTSTAPEIKRSHPTLSSIGLLLFLGGASYYTSEKLADLLLTLGINLPSIIILSTIALVLAQLKWVKEIQGAQVFGLFGIYLFLAVIGAFCDIQALAALKTVGLLLLGYMTIVVIVHGLVAYGLGAFLVKDSEVISIASQANIGGGTTALALARSFNRNELILPAVLIGSLGNALGTYLGFIMAGLI